MLKIFQYRNNCSHTINLGTTNYSLLTTGYCDTDISSKEECETAAYHLGLPDTRANAVSRSDRPYGCISSRTSGSLQWNVPGVERGSPSCGSSGQGGAVQDCICAPTGNIVSIFIILNY